MKNLFEGAKITVEFSPESIEAINNLATNLKEVVGLLSINDMTGSPKVKSTKKQKSDTPKMDAVNKEIETGAAIEAVFTKEPTTKPVELFEVIKLINEYSKKDSVDAAKKLVASYGVKATKDLKPEQLQDIYVKLNAALKG